MKKFFFIVFALQFSLVCFSQSDNIHHYTDQEVTKLTHYIAELEKKISSTTPNDSLSEDRKQITALFKDTTHNYYGSDIIKIFKFIKDLEKKVAFIKMSSNDTDVVEAPSELSQPVLLVKGIVIFEDGMQNNYSNISITVTDKGNSEIIGIYTPGSKTGKYLFILDPGKKYLVTAKVEGYQLYSEDFSPKNNKESYEMTQEIRLKKE
ncbi:MAG: hypothetical protein Q8L90_02270 [Bacteroidota bacterium]|nr:hypothetical protein [Bacteroidota bacterium]